MPEILDSPGSHALPASGHPSILAPRDTQAVVGGCVGHSLGQPCHGIAGSEKWGTGLPSRRFQAGPLSETQSDCPYSDGARGLTWPQMVRWSHLAPGRFISKSPHSFSPSSHVGKWLQGARRHAAPTLLSWSCRLPGKGAERMWRSHLSTAAFAEKIHRVSSGLRCGAADALWLVISLDGLIQGSSRSCL